MRYEDFVRSLGPVEYFDAQAFQPGGDASQAVCDFVVALAWVHGEIMDLFLAHQLLSEVRPDEQAKATSWGGHWAGIALHLLRIQAGAIHEFLGLIQRNRKVLDHPVFRKVLASVPGSAKKRWEAIVAVATGEGRPRDPLAKGLAIIRNKVAFHYHAARIGSAYRDRFKSKDAVPVLSAGPTLGASRFYFADAAADHLLFSERSTSKAKEALADPTLMEGIAAVLFYLVTHFMKVRGFHPRAGALAFKKI